MTAPLLKVEALTRVFGGLRAVSDVSFDVARGEICSVIGPNGAGKTSLFNLISGVLRPTSGRIVFDGADITRERPANFARRGIGRTFQNLALFKHGTVVENILVGRHVHTRSSERLISGGGAGRTRTQGRTRCARAPAGSRCPWAPMRPTAGR